MSQTRTVIKVPVLTIILNGTAAERDAEDRLLWGENTARRIMQSAPYERHDGPMPAGTIRCDEAENEHLIGGRKENDA